MLKTTRYFKGQIKLVVISPYAMSPIEAYLRYRQGRLLFMNWLERIRMYIGEFKHILLGKKHLIIGGS